MEVKHRLKHLEQGNFIYILTLVGSRYNNDNELIEKIKLEAVSKFKNLAVSYANLPDGEHGLEFIFENTYWELLLDVEGFLRIYGQVVLEELMLKMLSEKIYKHTGKYPTAT